MAKNAPRQTESFPESELRPNVVEALQEAREGRSSDLANLQRHFAERFQLPEVTFSSREEASFKLLHAQQGVSRREIQYRLHIKRFPRCT